MSGASRWLAASAGTSHVRADVASNGMNSFDPQFISSLLLTMDGHDARFIRVLLGFVGSERPPAASRSAIPSPLRPQQSRGRRGPLLARSEHPPAPSVPANYPLRV